ncbi:glycosyltransferase [Clostridium sp. OS1-26]|uniref:glycosyltransferase n=1 Tax=Clostridium sp. OS1-26 TaxID=3070681 RepID=UPI0027DFC8FE|nr:glycosyltransferase [Clostridium sp. OS1-26]WML37747.1 glycosyltransferase [Clostridium sp. OS1-26]
MVVTEAEKILHPRDWVSPATLEEHYKFAHYPEDFDILKEAMEKLYPSYKDVVKDVSNGNYGHFCNMFVMSRKTFFEYAEWLFNILFYVEDKLDFSTGKYKNEQKRVLGFLGERLLSYFVEYQRRNGAKIKEYQRLIGYLTIQDKQLFLKRFGVKAIKNILFKQDSSDYTEKKFSTEVSENKDSDIEKTEVVLNENENLHIKIPSVSIVVAMYKVEQYLRECIDSLVNQTLEDIEIIFVDNGSPDNSADIVKEYMLIDSRIRLIRLSENCLLPGARNAGQQVARGKYVAHVDGDDVCKQDMYEKLYLKAEELGADIVACSAYCFSENVDNYYLHRPLEWFRNSDVILPVTQRPEMFLEPAAWNKLFRRTYIESIGMKFTEGSSFGDEIPGMTKAFIETDKIAVVQEALYFYRIKREGSITSKMRKEYIDSIIYALSEQKRILMEHNFSDVNTMTFIVEFKILVMCYVLSGLSSKDKKYFLKMHAMYLIVMIKNILTDFFLPFLEKNIYMI